MREEAPPWVLVQVGKSRYRVAERDRVVSPGLWCYRAVTDDLSLDDARQELLRRRSGRAARPAA
jgi:hypothetical protein